MSDSRYRGDCITYVHDNREPAYGCVRAPINGKREASAASDSKPKFLISGLNTLQRIHNRRDSILEYSHLNSHL